MITDSDSSLKTTKKDYKYGIYKLGRFESVFNEL